jgi:hypothetical protein
MKGLVLGAALFVTTAVASVNSFDDLKQKYGNSFTIK